MVYFHRILNIGMPLDLEYLNASDKEERVKFQSRNPTMPSNPHSVNSDFIAASDTALLPKHPNFATYLLVLADNNQCA